MAGNIVPRHTAQAVIILRGKLRGTTCGLREAGVYLFERGDDAVADEVARIVVRLICAVLHMGDCVFGKILLDLLSCHAEQRADDVVPPCGDAAQTGCSAAAGQIENKGLGVVIGIVGGGDEPAIQLLRCGKQERISKLPRGLFDADRLFGGIGRYVPMTDPAGDAVFRTVVFNKPSVPQGFLAADAMLEMSGGHVDPGRGEQMQQAHGIRAAGDRAENAAPLQRAAVKINSHLRGVSQRS